MNHKLLSLIIPAHNEAENIEHTVGIFHQTLLSNHIAHEILVINDNSTDDTRAKVSALSKKIKEVTCVDNIYPSGFGFAVRTGLDTFAGDYVALVMADLSDDPNDLVQMFHAAEQGVDCVFGSRFTKGAIVTGYPPHKLVLNRIINNIIKMLFLIRYNDVTNAFKLYSRETIEGLKPFLSPHFNLTVELPLKAIVRGYSFTVIPTNWVNRTKGISKLKIKEMGGRYFFIILYCYLEKLLSMGDYRKKQ